jgi:hypothetical protein
MGECIVEGELVECTQEVQRRVELEHVGVDKHEISNGHIAIGYSLALCVEQNSC